jgi:pre-rRNA-processing protein TSR2
MQEKFDLSIALTLAFWPALTVAVDNGWGGPNSSEKRDWFAGAISEFLATPANADVDYLEEFLLQVMNDEFEAFIDDGSGEEVAMRIIGLRKQILEADFKEVDAMLARWTERQRRGVPKMIVQEAHPDDVETDGDSQDDESDDSDEDEAMDMDEAPELVRVSREKQLVEVDEEGFTKVVGRLNR